MSFSEEKKIRIDLQKMPIYSIDLVALWLKNKFQIIKAGNTILEFFCRYVQENCEKLLKYAFEGKTL